MISLFMIIGFVFSISTAFAQNNNACNGGSYSIVQTPDGATLSVLFDQFVVESGGSTPNSLRARTCVLEIPLALPAGYSLGIYKVDYRGFAQLSDKQFIELSVFYTLGESSNGRRFQRKLKGAYSADFQFTENIGAGLMKRVGCGENAKLGVSLALSIDGKAASASAMAGLDSLDGAPHGGLVYHFEYKKCR